MKQCLNLSPSWVGFCAKPVLKRRIGIISVPPMPRTVSFLLGREITDTSIFTHDLDFGALLATTRAESPSVFQLRTDDVSPDALAPRAIELLRRFTPQLLAGALIVVDEMRERIRILPLEIS
jgi:hypothetical protein